MGARRIARWIGAGVVAVTLGTVAGGPLASPAGADPILVEWSDLLPSMTDAYNPNSDNACTAGRPQCLDATIKEMKRRYGPLASTCDHNAVFGLAYLRTTQTYKWARDQQGFFQDTPFVNHEDAVFGKYYFNAYDAWKTNNRLAVPQAWLIAFDAARDHRVSGTGNLMLGMNAHVNRDLPYVLAAIGLVTPGGQSRKADHDKVNTFLNAVLEPLIAEEAAHYDATLDDNAGPLGIGYTSTFQALEGWREEAWRNAERLVNAPDNATRAQVAAEIEQFASAQATSLVLATEFAYPMQTSASRDAYCMAHRTAPAPMAYPFGTV